MNSRLLLEVRRSLRPFMILMVLIALGVIAFAGIFRNLTFERPWQGYNEIRAEFDDVKGIFPGGHQVRINGVKVGVVSKADLEPGNRAVLTMKIEDQHGDVFQNAKMRIRPVTPLQDLYVNITDRGDASAGVATKETVIKAENTVSPVDVSRVLAQFNADTRTRMSILLEELGKGLGDDGGERLAAAFTDLAPFLKVAEDATETLARRDRNVRRLVHNFGNVAAALAERDRDINRFITEGNDSLGELAQNDTQLAATFQGISDLLPVMRSSFTSLRALSDDLDPALESLEPVTEELEEGLKGLEKFGGDATPALRALRPAVTDLRSMARQLSPTSRSLDQSFGRLTQEVAPALDTVTAQTVVCLDEVTRFFNNTMSVLKFEDANGAFPRAETTVDLDTLPGAVVPGTSTTRLPNCTDNIGD